MEDKASGGAGFFFAVSAGAGRSKAGISTSATLRGRAVTVARNSGRPGRRATIGTCPGSTGWATPKLVRREAHAVAEDGDPLGALGQPHEQARQLRFERARALPSERATLVVHGRRARGRLAVLAPRRGDAALLLVASREQPERADGRIERVALRELGASLDERALFEQALAFLEEGLRERRGGARVRGGSDRRRLVVRAGHSGREHEERRGDEDEPICGYHQKPPPFP